MKLNKFLADAPVVTWSTIREKETIFILERKKKVKGI